MSNEKFGIALENGMFGELKDLPKDPSFIEIERKNDDKDIEDIIKEAHQNNLKNGAKITRG